MEMSSWILELKFYQRKRKFIDKMFSFWRIFFQKAYNFVIQTPIWIIKIMDMSTWPQKSKFYQCKRKFINKIFFIDKIFFQKIVTLPSKLWLINGLDCCNLGDDYFDFWVQILSTKNILSIKIFRWQNSKKKS